MYETPYGDRYQVKHGDRCVTVLAFSRKNARLSGSRKLGVGPGQVWVSESPQAEAIQKSADEHFDRHED